MLLVALLVVVVVVVVLVLVLGAAVVVIVFVIFPFLLVTVVVYLVYSGCVCFVRSSFCLQGSCSHALLRIVVAVLLLLLVFGPCN